MKDSEKGAGGTEKTVQVESMPNARQAGRLAEVISAARAKLEDEGEVLLRIPAASGQEPQPQQKPLDRPHPRRQRVLTVSTWTLGIATATLALFVFTSPLHLGHYSGVSYRADIILGISYIALGISVIALCVLIGVRNSWFRTGESQR